MKCLLPILFLLASCRDPYPLSGPAYAIDGDTLIVDQTKVRLWGIDAPELATFEGIVAKRTLAILVLHERVRCTKKGASYDRVVAQCFVGSTDLAAMMVSSGNAKDWPSYSQGYYKRFEP